MASYTANSRMAQPALFLYSAKDINHVYRKGEEVTGEITVHCPVAIFVRTIPIVLEGKIVATEKYSDPFTSTLFSISQLLGPSQVGADAGSKTWTFSLNLPMVVRRAEGLDEILPPSMLTSFDRDYSISVIYSLSVSVDLVEMRKLTASFSLAFEPFSQPADSLSIRLWTLSSKHTCDSPLEKLGRFLSRPFNIKPGHPDGFHVSVATSRDLAVGAMISLKILAKPVGDDTTALSNKGLKVVSIQYTHKQSLYLPRHWARFTGPHTEQIDSYTISWSVIRPTWPLLLPLHSILSIKLVEVADRFQASFRASNLSRRHSIELVIILENEYGQSFKVLRTFPVTVYLRLKAEAAAGDQDSRRERQAAEDDIRDANLIDEQQRHPASNQREMAEEWNQLLPPYQAL